MYPAGPPWRPVPTGEFSGRDLRQELKERFRWLGQNYMLADKPGELRHELNRADEQALVLAVRNAKEISIENNIGVIRVPAEATVDVGGELDIPGRRPNRQQSN